MKVRESSWLNFLDVLLSSCALSFCCGHAFDIHFLQNPACAAEFFRYEKNVANINRNRAPVIFVIENIVAQAFIVAVENQADLLTVSVTLH